MAQQERRKVTDFDSRKEGSRWIGDRPSGDEVAEWFLSSVRLDEGMLHQDWVGGVTMISAQETVLGIRDGELVDLVRLAHVPYVRVDARIAYFWHLCEIRGWLGEIEPVAMTRLTATGYYNEHLPPGFAKLPIALAEGRSAIYLTCSQKVTVYSYDPRTGGKGRMVRNPPPATKQLPMLNRWGKPDENLMMKAETGAIGRALGMAGIFVLPGSGVATAEDMAEFLASENASTAAGVAELEPQLPDESNPEKSVEQRIADLRNALDEEGRIVFESWAGEKGINLDEIRSSAHRSVLLKLEQLAPAEA